MVQNIYTYVPTPSQPQPFFFFQWNLSEKRCPPPIHVKGGKENVFFYKLTICFKLEVFLVGKLIKGKGKEKKIWYFFWGKALPTPPR